MLLQEDGKTIVCWQNTKQLLADAGFKVKASGKGFVVEGKPWDDGDITAVIQGLYAELGARCVRQDAFFQLRIILTGGVIKNDITSQSK